MGKMAVSLIVLNILLPALAAAIGAGMVSLRLFGSLLDALHNTIGITTPTPRQVRWVAVVWIASTLIIVDGLALLLTYVF
jgi:hypothetical protein